MIAGNIHREGEEVANTNRVRQNVELAEYVQVPVASATSIEIGDMVKTSGGLGTAVSAATDNLTLHAVSMQDHDANSGAKTLNMIRVKPGVLYRFALNAATDITYGDELQISGAQELKKSGTDPVANAVETKTGATDVLVEFKLPVTLQGDTS
jgi:hypothetical protein